LVGEKGRGKAGRGQIRYTKSYLYREKCLCGDSRSKRRIAKKEIWKGSGVCKNRSLIIMIPRKAFEKKFRRRADRIGDKTRREEGELC